VSVRRVNRLNILLSKWVPKLSRASDGGRVLARKWNFGIRERDCSKNATRALTYSEHSWSHVRSISANFFARDSVVPRWLSLVIMGPPREVAS
jgi:hypothetical protein